MALSHHSAAATAATPRRTACNATSTAALPEAVTRQNYTSPKFSRAIQCSAQLGGDAFGGLARRVSGPPQPSQQRPQPVEPAPELPVASDGPGANHITASTAARAHSSTESQLRPWAARRAARLAAPDSSTAPLSKQPQHVSATTSSGNSRAHGVDAGGGGLGAVVSALARRRRAPPRLRTVTPDDIRQWSASPEPTHNEADMDVSVQPATAASLPSAQSAVATDSGIEASVTEQTADGASTKTSVTSAASTKQQTGALSPAATNAAGTSWTPKGPASTTSTTGWAPKGPDAKPDAASGSGTDKGQKGKGRAWVNSWITAPNGAAAATGRGNLFANSSPASSTADLTNRAARNRNMLDSWGDSLGPSSSAGGNAARNGSAGAAQTLASGPRLEQTNNRAWQLVGCDSELGDLPKNVAVLQARLAAAIKAEQEAEAAALAALYSRTSVSKLQKEGAVLAGLRAAPGGELYRNIVWQFSQSSMGPASRGRSGSTGGDDGNALPYHKFRQGDGVLISRFVDNGGAVSAPAAVRKLSSVTSDGEDDDLDVGAWFVEGTVLEVKRTYLSIALERKDSDRFEAYAALWARGPKPTSAVQWRLDTSVRDVTANRQRDALGRLGQWHGTGSITTHRPPSGGEALVRLSLTTKSIAVPILAEQPPVWVREAAWRESAKNLLAAQNNLNDSQRRAVAAAMVRSVTLWQGPPGTGKTRTLLALIAVLVGASASNRSSWSVMGPLLACADTNAAVDNIVEGLISRGVRVVRVGNPAKVRPTLRHVTLEALAEKDTAAGRESARIRQEAQKKLEAVHMARDGATASTPPGMLERWAATEVSARSDLTRADQLLKVGMEEVLCTAQVVCATCAGAGDAMLASHTFKVVVIDEASQATEPATLVPLTRGAECVVMAGDPRQLPPTVTSRKALEYMLDVTLFDRLSSSGLSPLLLDTQYRMHTALSAFPSMHFYQRRLRDGVKDQDKPIPRGIAWPNPSLPLVFLQVFGREERASIVGVPSAAAETDNDGSTAAAAAAGGKARKKASSAADGAGGASYRNKEEAVAAMQALELLAAGGDVSSVALLTPYKGQVRALETLVRQLPMRVCALMDAGKLEVTVSSVDGFQGREADAVIFTAVRSNPRRTIGFVADPRRLNVAITRPKRGLVVLGEDATLAAGSSDWKEYIAWLREKGLVVPAEHVLGGMKTALQHAAQLSSDGDDSLEASISDSKHVPTSKRRQSLPQTHGARRRTLPG